MPRNFEVSAKLFLDSSQPDRCDVTPGSNIVGVNNHAYGFHFFYDSSFLVTSPGSGNLPVSDLENTRLSSTLTSKMPLLPATRFASTPNSLRSSSARLAAFG